MRKVLQNLAWLTQLGLSIMLPPLLCIGGAFWLRQRFSLGGWIMALGIVLGLGAAFSSAYKFYKIVLRQSKKEQKDRGAAFNTHE